MIRLPDGVRSSCLTPVNQIKAFAICFPARIDVRVSGPHPEHLSYGSFVSFKGPDGNGWLLQEVT